MMKIITIATLLLCLDSCSNKLDKKNLYGSWKLKTTMGNSGVKISDKTTYMENDSFIVQLFLENSLYREIKGKYSFEQAENILTASVSAVNNPGQAGIKATASDTILSWRVKKLSAEELDLADIKTNKITQYVRYR